MRSLHDVREINSRKAALLSLSVSRFQLENRWTDFDEMLYGQYNIPDTFNLIRTNMLQLNPR
jgi:hypothetical protein